MLLKRASKGLVALLPIIISIWLFTYVYDLFEGLFRYVFGMTDHNLQATLFIFTVTLLFLYYIGYLIEKNREFLLLKFTEIVIDRIPVFKTVYSIVKDIINLFSGSKNDSYLGVVYVKIGATKLLGFITKRDCGVVTVFVPTTPNPTTGLLLFCDEKDVEMSDMDVKEGFRKIISLGIK